jgi:hypothetical protein
MESQSTAKPKEFHEGWIIIYSRIDKVLHIKLCRSVKWHTYLQVIATRRKIEPFNSGLETTMHNKYQPTRILDIEMLQQVIRIDRVQV